MNKKTLFNVSMSSAEARRVLFASVNGKTKAEVERIKKEYSAVSKQIVKRELSEGRGWLTSD